MHKMKEFLRKYKNIAAWIMAVIAVGLLCLTVMCDAVMNGVIIIFLTLVVFALISLIFAGLKALMLELINLVVGDE